LPGAAQTYETGTDDYSDDEEDERQPVIGKRRPSRDEGVVVGKPRMSTLDMFALSVSMGGAQIIWTMELGCVQFA
jgi:hypothetical protein